MSEDAVRDLADVRVTLAQLAALVRERGRESVLWTVEAFQRLADRDDTPPAEVLGALAADYYQELQQRDGLASAVIPDGRGGTDTAATQQLYALRGRVLAITDRWEDR